MNQNIISASLSEEAVRLMRENLAAIRDQIPFAVQLTGAQLRTLPKISTGSAYFVEDSLKSARQNPMLVSTFLDVEEMERDLTLYKQLTEVLLGIQQLTDLIESTAMVAGSEAYQAALHYYSAVKRAAQDGVPGANAIYEMLKRRFERSGPASAPEKASEPVAVAAGMSQPA